MTAGIVAHIFPGEGAIQRPSLVVVVPLHYHGLRCFAVKTKRLFRDKVWGQSPPVTS